MNEHQVECEECEVEFTLITNTEENPSFCIFCGRDSITIITSE